MNRYVAIITVTLSLFWCQREAPAAQDLTIYTEPLAPVHFEQEGHIIGIATDIVKEIVRLAGYTAHFEIYPWNRAYYLVQKNPESFIYTLNRTRKREKLFKWIGPILHKKTYLYKLRERNDIQLNNFDDAKKYTTAVLLGHSLTLRLKDLGFQEGNQIIVTSNKTIQTKVFLEKRCDLITGNEYTIYRAMQAAGLTMEAVEPALLLGSSSYYLGANLHTPDTVIIQLQKASQSLFGSQFTKDVIREYMNH